MKNLRTLKSASRIDNKNGYLITKKSYVCEILKNAPYNFVVIKIGDKIFKTDSANLVTI